MACHPLCPASGCLRTPLISPPKTGRPPRKPRSKTSTIGQPKSPWRIRKEEESLVDRSEDAVIRQIEAAIRAGKVDGVIAQLTGVLALSSFSAFCQSAWHVIEPSTKLDWGRHHELLCTVLQGLVEDWLKTKTDFNYVPNILNTVINCPPGSLKSKLVSVFLHAWIWLRCPGARFIYLCVNESAAMRDARATRDLVRSNWYQDTFKPTWSIKGDQDAVSDFGNSESGGRLSQASGSEIVGLRGDFLIIDDANNPMDSSNKSERARVNALWDDNQSTRVNDPVKSMRIGIQQRTHADDWTGHIIAKQGLWSPRNRMGWFHVILPAEFERSRPAFRIPGPLKELVAHLPRAEFKDWRTKDGEVLHPKRMTPETIADDKRKWAGTGNYAGQMQQRPSSEGGGKIKKEWFGWFRLARGVRDDYDQDHSELSSWERPVGCKGSTVTISGALLRPECWDFDSVILSVDPALKKTETGSLWGMLAIGIKGAQHFVLDDRSHRGEPNEAISTLKDMIRYWRPDKVLVEEKAGGSGMLDTLRIEMADATLPMSVLEPVNPGTQDKDIRVNSSVPHFANGMVFLLEGAPWVEELVAEVSGFNTYTTDDRVDCLTQCIMYDRHMTSELPSGGAWASAGL